MQDLKKKMFATHYNLYLKAGGNTVAKNQKSDTTTILGAFRIYEILTNTKTPQEQITNELDPNKKPIYVEKSLGPQTESPWFLIPSEFFTYLLKLFNILAEFPIIVFIIQIIFDYTRFSK